MGRRGRRHRVLEPGRVAAARGRHPRGRAAALRVARAPRRRVCAPPPVFPRRGRTMFRILDDLIRVGETGLRELWLRGSAPATDGRRRRAALLLDYGRGRERERLAAWGVRPGLRFRVVGRLARPVRDQVVRPPHAADGLYVGRAFVTSTFKLPVSCFALERWSPMPAALAGPGTPGSREERTA